MGMRFARSPITLTRPTAPYWQLRAKGHGRSSFRRREIGYPMNRISAVPGIWTVTFASIDIGPLH